MPLFYIGCYHEKNGWAVFQFRSITKPQIPKAFLKKKLIPYATDRKAQLLIVAVPAYTAIKVVHVPVPGEIGIVLRSTPPETAVANTVERTIVVTVATGKSCKAGFVGCSGVWALPMRGTGLFQLAPGNTFATQIIG